ncbi:MAG: ABC transporter permease [Bacillota bacterium]|nr:ABC transporter permease [Bacillota bacterium]
MKTILIVFKANLKRALNNKGKLIINLFLPIAAIVMAMFANYVSSPSINIGIVEKANFPEEQRIISLLKQTKGINVEIAQESMVKTNVILGRYSGVITFKEEFKRGEAVDLNKYFDFYTVKDEGTKKLMEGITRSYLAKDEAIDEDSINKELQAGMPSTATRIISFLTTILLITCVVNGAVIIKDKTENTFNRFLYSPNRKFQYILGNVIYNYLFSYTQLLLAFIITYIFGMKLGLSLGTLLAYGLVLVFVTTTFGTLITAIFNKELYANLFASAISLILSLVGGAFISYDKMPKALQFMSNITPNRWIIKSVDWLEHGVRSGMNPTFILLIFSLVFSMTASFMSRAQRA